jgi:uncharacterized protein YkwD
LEVEGLETRDAPAVVGLKAMTPVLTNGVLTIIGNDNANTINVTREGNQIKVLGKSFNYSAVQMIVIDGRGGDDTIRVAESIKIPAYLYGGWGNDTIYGGGGNDVIYGGLGNDTIFGGGGDDKIYGRAGKDTIDGGAGTNYVLDYQTIDVVTNAITTTKEASKRVNYKSDTYVGQVINEILRLVNLERAKVGKAPLVLDTAINWAARNYAQVMNALKVPMGTGISHAFSGHERPVLESRLEANLINYNVAGENNGYIFSSTAIPATQLAKIFMYGTNGQGGWMNSSGHRANILNGEFTKIGLGLAGTAQSGYYAVQIFTG